MLQVGDRILSVDDTNLKDASHQYAVSVIKNAGLNIRLVVERFNKWVSRYSILRLTSGRNRRRFPSPNLLILISTPQQNDIFNVSEGDDKSVTLDKCHPPPVTPAKTPECIVVQVGASLNAMQQTQWRIWLK